MELVDVEANPLRDVAPVWNERRLRRNELRQLAFMLTVHRGEGSSTPDDHETERSSEWIRNLENFSGRVGAGTQRTISSDADAVAAVSIHGRRSGRVRVGMTRAAARSAEFRHAPGHDEGSNTGTQPTRSRVAQARRTGRDKAGEIRCSPC